MRSAIVTLGLALAALPSPAAPLIGPYKDVSAGIDAATPRIAEPAWLAPPRQGEVLLWAFATGECGNERWGDFDTAEFARLNVAAAERAGRDFIVSTGGEAGGFFCDSPAGLQRFLARYASPRLLGLDFDIERNQTAEQIGALVRQAQAAQRAQPALRISFTLATHAGSDAARRSLNATGETVLKAVNAAGLDGAIINLMVMNYGPADPRWCVVAADGQRCDMARSAVQAAHNLHAVHGVPYARIALTLMLGENDVAGNLTTPDDARFVAAAARRMNLAGLHWWSLDRDRPCAPGAPRVSPACHGLPDTPAGAFGKALQP